MKKMVVLGLQLTHVIALGCGWNGSTNSQIKVKQSVFEFNSGGVCHPEGFGEWSVSLSADRSFSVIHDICGTAHDYGEFSLTDDERVELWESIGAVGFDSLSSSAREGVPNEIKYSFRLTAETVEYFVELWAGDASENEQLQELLVCVKSVIETYTGESPVF